MPKDYIQANREMNSRALGAAKRHLGSGWRLYLRGWLYVLGVFLVLNYVVPPIWNRISAFFR